MATIYTSRDSTWYGEFTAPAPPICAIAIGLAVRHYNSVRTTGLHCDYTKLCSVQQWNWWQTNKTYR